MDIIMFLSCNETMINYDYDYDSYNCNYLYPFHFCPFKRDFSQMYPGMSNFCFCVCVAMFSFSRYIGDQLGHDTTLTSGGTIYIAFDQRKMRKSIIKVNEKIPKKTLP